MSKSEELLAAILTPQARALKRAEAEQIKDQAATKREAARLEMVKAHAIELDAHKDIEWHELVRAAFINGAATGLDRDGATEAWPYSETATAIEWDKYEDRKRKNP